MTDMSGERVVYRVGKEIHTWNLLTNATHLVYTDRLTPLTLLLDGRWIVYHNNTENLIRGILLPALP